MGAAEQDRADKDDQIRTLKEEIDHQNDTGATAFMAAAMCGHETTVELLSIMGADHNIKTNDGQQTAATFAATYGHETVVKYLSDCPMNPIEEFYKELKRGASPPIGLKTTRQNSLQIN